MWVGERALVSAGTCEEVWYPIQLEQQAVVSHTKWVLGAILSTFATVV